MVKRNLDGVHFRIMRDGHGLDVCWTDLEWEDRIAVARKNNNEGWLISMIQTMNDVAWEIQDKFPNTEIKPVVFREDKKTTKTWLRNSLFRLTADIRLVAEEHNIKAA